ncbi:hypothetical protein Gotri_018715 [Gossypium trilobum]|uniref:Uncharacterized protein n=1 Tax=Gossypium trilobum TaxID=34281 RepID=A0A7J9EAJ3_9ROSI|nr:hypothetical protein [Gossypium trilobum]
MNLMTTPEYSLWWGRRINDNIPMSSQEDIPPIEEHLSAVPSELEIIKQDFEKRSSELGKKIEQLEEEKIRLGLDDDIHKLEAEKLRKGKNKAEEDLDSLKTDYKKLHLSIRTAGLGKTSEQWRQEINEENTRAGLRAQVAGLEKSLHQYHSRNSAIELRASLSKIEELKGKIRELEDALQNYELWVELLDRSNEQWQEQHHRSQGQIRERDYIMGEAVAQSHMVNSRDDQEDPAYPPGFTPTNTKAQPEMCSQRVPVTIKPQHQAGASVPMNFPTGSGSNPGDNPTNPVVLDLDDVTSGEMIENAIRCGKIEVGESAKRAMVQNLMDNKELEFYEEIKGLEEGEFYTSEEGSTGKSQRANHPVVIISWPRSTEAGIQMAPRVIIQKHVSFPYKDSKRVLWNYDCNVMISGEENPVNASEEDT